MILRASGILFKTPDNRALFVKRAPTADHPGEWCFPGGKIENGETPEEAARREAIEEVGSCPAKTFALLARSISVTDPQGPDVAALPPVAAPGVVGPEALPAPAAPVDFTTFVADVDEFAITLDPEHVGYAWSPLTYPPEPLHPGCRIALDRLTMDELGVARAMADGRLTSPQRYKNVTLWNMRITGTGVALRSAVKDAKGKVIRGEEFPWRDPALYLDEDFLARCNGLPVIWIHPDKAILDSKSYAEQNVGSIFLPYIRGNEVWGIAKVFDDAANAAMIDGTEDGSDWSTSPAVVVSDPNSPSYKLTMQDGSTLLIEGKPSLLDHLAICEKGVWDKGGDAAGIINDSQGEKIIMAKEDEDQARKDAEERETKRDATLDKLLTCMDSVMSRMDAFEAKDKEKADAEEKAKADAGGEDKPGDAEKFAADAKKDADEKEAKEKADAEEKAEKEKADAVKADAEATRKRIDAIEKMLPKERTDSDMAVMTDAQAKADNVARAFGKSAPRFLNGEDILSYRRRLARDFQEHSPAWKAVDLGVLNDSVLTVAEAAIYTDAMAAAMNPKIAEDGGLRMIERTLPSGHRERQFVGHPSAWMGRFSGSKRFATKINPLVRQEMN